MYHVWYRESWWQGRRQSSWTLCPVSGCCLYGALDSGGQFTGDNIAWVYPDYRTALLGNVSIFVIVKTLTRILIDIFSGKFVNGKMVEASPATVRNGNNILNVHMKWPADFSAFILCSKFDVKADVAFLKLQTRHTERVVNPQIHQGGGWKACVFSINSNRAGRTEPYQVHSKLFRLMSDSCQL